MFFPPTGDCEKKHILCSTPSWLWIRFNQRRWLLQSDFVIKEPSYSLDRIPASSCFLFFFLFSDETVLNLLSREETVTSLTMKEQQRPFAHLAIATAC